ncbi:hypothetical protein VNO77_23113 [Canavalia gladiata]|uniref:Uncharacterized protein n=1 Tax=Canavalia gladiata TaxID=3824 RepID=A0AAN9L943_CANGL
MTNHQHSPVVSSLVSCNAISIRDQESGSTLEAMSGIRIEKAKRDLKKASRNAPDSASKQHILKHRQEAEIDPPDAGFMTRLDSSKISFIGFLR